MPKISVIVPVYNVEKYIAKCLDSIINQTLKDIEIIVVNDGSPDNSQSIIDVYVNKFPNLITCYIKENGGLSSTRNFGLSKASGEFISFIDSDDWINPLMLEKMYNEAVDKSLDIVVCDVINYFSFQKQTVVNSNRNLSRSVIKNYFIAAPMACTKIYRRFLFNNTNFKKDIFYEDLELVPTLITQTEKIGFINEPFYYYLQRPGSIMNQLKFNDRIIDIFTVLESIKNKMILAKKYGEYKEEIEYLYIEHLLRTASLRFVIFKTSKKYLNNIVEIMKKDFPNWKNNIYYKKRGLGFRLICFFASKRNTIALRLINILINISK